MAADSERNFLSVINKLFLLSLSLLKWRVRCLFFKAVHNSQFPEHVFDFCRMSALLTVYTNRWSEDGPHHAAEYKHLHEECLVFVSAPGGCVLQHSSASFPFPVLVHRGRPRSLLYSDCSEECHTGLLYCK